MRILYKVLTTSMGSVIASLIIFITVVLAVQDFFYFKKFMVTGTEREVNYTIALTQNYLMLMFGEFAENMENYDLIDLAMFIISTFVTMIVLTNILIAYMGDAYEHVQTTMEICEG